MLEQLFLLILRCCGFSRLLWSPAFQRARKRFSTSRLELGLSKELEIRREPKALPRERNRLKVLYVSDIHLHPTWEIEIAHQLRRVVEAAAPDVILLGGDLVDDKNSLPTLTALITDLTTFAPVLAVSGNHDVVLGEDQVRASVISGGGKWLPDGPFELPGAFQKIRILGSPLQARSDGALQILCAHDPCFFAEAAAKEIDFMLAGHIHGGQVVLWHWKDKMYPGAFAYAWNGLRFISGRTQLFVSRGIVDFFPLRWRCPREVILLEV